MNAPSKAKRDALRRVLIGFQPRTLKELKSEARRRGCASRAELVRALVSEALDAQAEAAGNDGSAPDPS